MRVLGAGRQPCRIMIVGESWGEEEEAQRLPFVGKSGALLDQILANVGVARADCYVTNVCSARPPKNKVEEWWTTKAALAKRNGLNWRHGDYYFNDHVAVGLTGLHAEIDACQPEVIVALGNLAMWALTGAEGIANWRGSELWYEGLPTPHEWDHEFKRKKGEPGQLIATDRLIHHKMQQLPRIPVIPTYHPAYVLRVWEWKAAVTRDFRMRVVGKLANPVLRVEPNWRFQHQPTFAEAKATLEALVATAKAGPLEIVPDLETRRGRIACVGLAWSGLDAICLPFMHVDGRRYWGPAEEEWLASQVRTLLTHPSVRVCNQNFNYDRQYLVRDPAFNFRAPCHWDTMVAQHLYWPGTPKDLAYLASLYCPWYRFWKEEGKEIEGDADEERWWWYCCLDTVNTFTIWQSQKQLLKQAGLA